MEIDELGGQVTLRTHVDNESEIASAIKALADEAEKRRLLIWGVWSELRDEGNSFEIKLFGGEH